MCRVCSARLPHSLVLPLVLLIPLAACAPASAEGGTWPPVAQLAGGLPYSVAIQGDYAYVAAFAGMTVLDISSPGYPLQVGYCDMPFEAWGVAVAGGYAYVADRAGGLRVIDVSNPAAPTEVGYLGEMVANAVAIAGGYAYVADPYGGLRLIDVSDPSAPVQVGVCATPGDPAGVAVVGGYAYVADGFGLAVVNISNPSAPVQTGFYDTNGYTGGVAVSGNYAYLAGGSDGLIVIDVSNPAAPAFVASCAAPDYALGVAVAGGYAYLADSAAGLRVMSISNPAAPAQVGFFDTPGTARGVALVGNYAYVADDSYGLRVIDVSNPAAPTEPDAWDTPANAQDVAVSGGYAYIADEQSGLRVVSIDNPAVPVEVGHCWTTGWAYGVAVAGGYAYVADGGSGLWVIDVSNPAAPVAAGTCAISPGYCFSVAVAGSYAYVAAAWGGLRVIDISNPAAPVLVGSSSAPSDAQDVKVVSGYAYVADLSGYLRIIDVSYPSAPGQVGYCAVSGNPRGVAVANGYAYVVGAWTGLHIIDVSHPSTPAEVGYFSADWDAYCVAVSGNLAFVGDDITGLHVIDVSNPTAPVEVGSYVTPGHPRGMTVANERVYEADSTWGLMVFPDQVAGTVAGQVRLRATSTNIQGATVDLYDGRLKEPGVTDANGIYSMLAPAGRWAFVAYKPGYISQTKAGIPVLAGETTYVNFALDLSGAVSGQVKDRATGAVLPLAEIRIYSGGVLRSGAPTNDSGIYLANSDLPSGVYVLTASRAGYITQVKANVTITAGQTTYVNFNLDRLCIKGQVRAAGSNAPLGGAMVRAYQGDVLKATATTDAGGIYEISGLANGTYTVVASAGGYVKQTKPDISVTAGNVAYVNFNLQVSGKLKGQVTNRVTGAPVIGATVSARIGGVVQATAVTSAPYGIYEIASDLPAGTYSMLASKAGYMDQGKSGIAVSDGATTYINFSLDPICLSGQVRRADTGTNLAGATVTAYWSPVLSSGNTASADANGIDAGATVTGYRSAALPGSFAITDANGIYRMAGLPTSTYDVIASKAGYVKQIKAGIAVTAGVTTYVNFNLQVSGKLKGQVTANGVPVIGATITARSGGVVQAVGTTVAPYGIYEITSDLPAGTYVVGASKAGYLGQTRKDIPVTAGATTYVNFNLAPGG